MHNDYIKYVLLLIKSVWNNMKKSSVFIIIITLQAILIA